MGHSSSNHKKKHCFPAPSPHRPAKVNTNGDGETAIDLAYRYPQLAQLLQRHVDAYGWTGSAPQDATDATESNDGA